MGDLGFALLDQSEILLLVVNEHRVGGEENIHLLERPTSSLVEKRKRGGSSQQGRERRRVSRGEGGRAHLRVKEVDEGKSAEVEDSEKDEGPVG